MSTFEDEFAEAFKAFSDPETGAGVVATHKESGKLVQGCLATPTVGQLQLEISLGKAYLCRFEALRVDLPNPLPVVGDCFVIRGIPYDIADIQRHDISDPVVVFKVRVVPPRK